MHDTRHTGNLSSRRARECLNTGGITYGAIGYDNEIGRPKPCRWTIYERAPDRVNSASTSNATTDKVLSSYRVVRCARYSGET
jgi:hypothetical protein